MFRIRSFARQLRAELFSQEKIVTRAVFSATSRARVFAIQFRLVKIGIARVSTRDQHPESQEDALRAAGCEKVFTDKASGKLARRPGLDNALLIARQGDQLVVTKLDRLGRSLEHLIGPTGACHNFRVSHG